MRTVINYTERFIGFLQKQYCYQWLMVLSGFELHERVFVTPPLLNQWILAHFSLLRETIFPRCQSLWPNLIHKDFPLQEMLGWEQQRISIHEFICHLTTWKQDIFPFCWKTILPTRVMLSEFHVRHCSIYSKECSVMNLEYGSFKEMSYMFYSQESI